MKYGLIIRNVTNLRAKPDFRTERKSQLLFGEAVEVGNIRRGYFKVWQNDGYHGWVRIKAVKIITKIDWLSYQKSLTHQIMSQTAKLYPLSNSFESPTPRFLFYGTNLALLRTRKNIGLFLSPDGNKYKISLNNISPIASAKNQPNTGSKIVREAKRFLDTPFLWGGMTPFGFDCSGIVQMIYKRFGIILPRDSKDQSKVGEKVQFEKVKPGDLIYSPGHVVIAMAKNKIIHASLGEGGVAINSLKPGEPNFRKDLYDSLLIARRVIK